MTQIPPEEVLDPDNNYPWWCNPYDTHVTFPSEAIEDLKEPPR